jgi:hypothetical protein
MQSNRIDRKDKSAPNGAQSNQNSQAQVSAVPPLSSAERALLLKIVGDDRLNSLERIAKWIGVGVGDQLAGAAQAWISHNERMERAGDATRTSEKMRSIACLLNAELYFYVLQQERQFWISEDGRKTYKTIIAQLRYMQTDEALAFASGLLDLFQNHPGFADECRALDDFICAAHDLGNSPAIRPEAASAYGIHLRKAAA